MAKIPKKVLGTPVHESSVPVGFQGDVWHTLVPDDPRDDRVWEWGEKSGRVIQTIGRGE